MVLGTLSSILKYEILTMQMILIYLKLCNSKKYLSKTDGLQLGGVIHFIW